MEESVIECDGPMGVGHPSGEYMIVLLEYGSLKDSTGYIVTLYVCRSRVFVTHMSNDVTTMGKQSGNDWFVHSLLPLCQGQREETGKNV